MYKKEFKCLFCSKSFFIVSGFEQYKVNESYVYLCDDCGKVFISVMYFKKYKIMYLINRLFICEQCEKLFCILVNFCLYMRIVYVMEKKYKCFECGKVFVCRDKMKRYLLIYYFDIRLIFICFFCSYIGCMKMFYCDDKFK